MTGSAREALIAEALGDIAALLDRIEAVKPVLDVACQELTHAGEELAGKAADAECRIAAIAESTAALAVKHIARRANELVKNAGDTETRAMRAAMRELFNVELGQALHRLASTATPTWWCWWTHAATAVAAASLTWAVAVYFFFR